MSQVNEVSHYVVTAQPPGSVLLSTRCNFTAPDSTDVLVAKARRLEIRQKKEGDGLPFPLLSQYPINGRLVSLEPFQIPACPTSMAFLCTNKMEYAAISYNPNSTSHPITTHAHGSLLDAESNLGDMSETGPLVAMDPFSRCVVMYIYDGLFTIIPIHRAYEPRGKGGPTSTPRNVLGTPYHCRMEERKILSIQFLKTQSPEAMPILAVLHQDARNAQHLTTHLVNLNKRQLHLYGSQSAPPSTEWLKKSAVDGGSSMLIAVPPRSAVASKDDTANSSTTAKASTGGVVIIGQRQITYISATVTKVLPVTQSMFLTNEELPPDPNGMPRYLLGDEFGNIHMLTITTVQDKVVGLNLETLGSCNISNSLSYLGDGLLFVGSNMGDSQLIQIHDEPIPLEEVVDDADLADTTYLSVIEEYTNLGPIGDFDLIPTTPGADPSQMGQSQVVTASGTSKSGSLRLIRNGIGMNEYAAVEIPGIQNMWSIRKSYYDLEDAYLVQSFVQETRVLGVVTMDGGDEDEEGGASLEEVALPALIQTTATLYVGNVENGDRLLQITETGMRLASTSGELLDEVNEQITVATANEAGQIAIAKVGRILAYFTVENDKIVKKQESKMEHEISCLDLHPFTTKDAMEVDGSNRKRNAAETSKLLAVGLWDDFSVRVLSLVDSLNELLKVDLSVDETTGAEDDIAPIASSRQNRNNMMARSLCLVTLDLTSSTNVSGSGGVNMLFVGMGDGTLVSYALVERQGVTSAESKKEVCFGTQRIDLLPLTSDAGGTCVLATGDRPTVIYLAGIGGSTSTQVNPKLCYSNVNLSTSDDDEDDGISRPPSQQAISVNVASTFYCPALFDTNEQSDQRFSLCVADDASLRLGVIDDIQKLHVTTCKLGMCPRRIVHCVDGRLFAVGCIESGINHFSLGDEEVTMGNCIRFMDDTTFDDIERKDLESFEMVLAMEYVTLQMPATTDSREKAPSTQNFLVIGTAYALPDEEEPSQGRILLYAFKHDEESGQSSERTIRLVTELNVNGAVWSIAQFYNGKMLCTLTSKALMLQLVDVQGMLKLEFVGNGYHGHILSLFVKTLAGKTIDYSNEEQAEEGPVSTLVGDSSATTQQNIETEQLAIVGDTARSLGLVQYYPQHQTLEEVARDFNSSWTTTGIMLTSDIYLVADHWGNFYCLRRNKNATAEDIRCRLDTVGEFQFGEMANKFMRGSLVMPISNTGDKKANRRTVRRAASPQKRKLDSPGKKPAARAFRPVVTTGSQTLFGTVDGSLGVILGLDSKTAAFFSCLERAMCAVVEPIGKFSHELFHAFESDSRSRPHMGFVDGDLIESFLDLDRTSMERVVDKMNHDGGWHPMEDDRKENAMDEDVDHVDLSVDDVLAMVEEISLLH